MFLSSQATLRKGAFALAAIATLAGAWTLPSSQAHAQPANQVTYKVPDCSTIGEAAKRAVCESMQRTEDANRRGAEADRRGAAADARMKAEDQLKACLVTIQAFKAKSPDEFAKLGTITRENACGIASRLPKPTAGQPRPSG